MDCEDRLCTERITGGTGGCGYHPLGNSTQWMLFVAVESSWLVGHYFVLTSVDNMPFTWYILHSSTVAAFGHLVVEIPKLDDD